MFVKIQGNFHTFRQSGQNYETIRGLRLLQWFGNLPSFEFLPEELRIFQSRRFGLFFGFSAIQQEN